VTTRVVHACRGGVSDTHGGGEQRGVVQRRAKVMEWHVENVKADKKSIRLRKTSTKREEKKKESKGRRRRVG
jgi:hypothetical protein